MQLLIDGDHLFVYRIGFAVENDPYGLDAARYNIKKCLYDMLDELGTRKYTIYLSGKDNFRIERATIFPYKGNRRDKPNSKPKFYQDIRDILITEYSAVVVDGIEADDALGIAQLKHTTDMKDSDKTVTYNSIIVASDKDMDMIPGFHYNPLKKNDYFVHEAEANRNFGSQWLQGDWECDSIPGLRGMGPKTAQRIVKDCETLSDVEQVVLETYAQAVTDTHKIKLKGKIEVTITSPKDFHNLVDEIRDLIWIKRE